MSLSKRWIRSAITGAVTAALSITASGALYVGQIDASSLNLRATPNGAVIDSAPRGTKVAVINNSSEWFQVAVNGQTYYASGSYIDWVPECDFNIGTGTVKCSTTVNFRSEPNTSSSVLASLKNGQKVSVIGVSGGWYKATVNGKTGYICPDYLTINGGAVSDQSSAVGSTVDTSSDSIRQDILDYAAQFLGTPYVYGGSTPSGFDCSGFTSYVYKQMGISIARTSSAQRSTTKNISMDELLPGDLVFFGSNNVVSHVGIYVGNGNFIHSPHTGSVVKYDTLASGSYNLRFICGGRVL